MKKYLKIIAIGLLVGSMIACSKNEPEEPYNPEHETVLSANLGKVWEAEPEFPDNTGYFYLNVAFPNKFYNTFDAINGTLCVHNYGEKELLIGRGIKNDRRSVNIYSSAMQPGDGIDPTADFHYFDDLSFTCQEGTFDIRMEFITQHSGYSGVYYLCTPKLRITIGKDSQGYWTVALQVLEE